MFFFSSASSCEHFISYAFGQYDVCHSLYTETRDGRVMCVYTGGTVGLIIDIHDVRSLLGLLVYNGRCDSAN